MHWICDVWLLCRNNPYRLKADWNVRLACNLLVSCCKDLPPLLQKQHREEIVFVNLHNKMKMWWWPGWRTCANFNPSSTGNTCSEESIVSASSNVWMQSCCAVVCCMLACDEISAAAVLTCLSYINAITSVSAMGSRTCILLCVWTSEVPASLTSWTEHTRAGWK